MKRIGLTIVLAWVAWAAMAQVQIGPKVGLNLSTLSNWGELEEGEEKPLLAGFNAGLAANMMISEHFSVAPEVLFSQKGLKYRAQQTFVDATGTLDYTNTMAVTLSYLEVPLLARVTFGNTFKGYVNIGPSVGYWLGGRYKAEGYMEGEPFSEREKLKFVDQYSDNNSEGEIQRDEANRLELGAVVGGGLMVATSAGDVLLDLRYQRGLTSIQKLEESEDDRLENNTLSVSVIYLFLSK